MVPDHLCKNAAEEDDAYNYYESQSAISSSNDSIYYDYASARALTPDYPPGKEFCGTCKTDTVVYYDPGANPELLTTAPGKELLTTEPITAEQVLGTTTTTTTTTRETTTTIMTSTTITTPMCKGKKGYAGLRPEPYFGFLDFSAT